MEKTCKDCEHYEFYDGPDKTVGGLKAIMRCNSENPNIVLSSVLKRCGSYFTPKEPAKPDEKVVRKCSNCFLSPGNNKTGEDCNAITSRKGIGWCTNNGRCGWQPIPKPGQATTEEKQLEQIHQALKYPVMGVDVAKGESESFIMEIDAQGNVQKIIQPPKKAKETKMWNKLRKRGRRITMAWDLFGIFLLCRLVHPWVLRAWYWIIPKNFWEDTENHGDVFLPWMFTILSIAAILGALYSLDRLAAWWYGEKK